MARLRRSIALAVTAAAGLTGSAQAAAPTAEVVVGAPCAFTATGSVSNGSDTVLAGLGKVSGVGTLTCNPWFEYNGAVPKGGPALRACGTVQVDDPIARGLTANTVCDVGTVPVAAGARSELYVCTYLLTDGGVRALDLDGDLGNGTQCGTVARTENGTLSARQGGVGVGVTTSFTDVPWVPWPIGPDPHCAGCLSGVTPLPDMFLDAVLDAVSVLAV